MYLIRLQGLQAYFDNTWTLTETLFAALQGEEAFLVPPYHELRHPLIFYYAHPAAVYVNKMRVAGVIDAPVNKYFEEIFETGVDEMSWDDLSKNQMKWPSVKEVHEYRKQVYAVVSKVIQSQSEESCASIDQNSKLWSLLMGFEHERIHIETSSVLMTELPQYLVQQPASFPPYHRSAVPVSVTQMVNSVPGDPPAKGKDYPENEMIYVPSCTVTNGKDRAYPSFGWDNEYGARDRAVPAFKASKYLVTNGEFYEFVKEGGYANMKYWSEAGWKWRTYRNSKWPTFWVRSGPQGLHHDFYLRCIFDYVKMPWDWPVSVNFHEAAAFAKWKSLKSAEVEGQAQKTYRVMTELEHLAIRDSDFAIEKENKLDAVMSEHAKNMLQQVCIVST